MTQRSKNYVKLFAAGSVVILLLLLLLLFGNMAAFGGPKLRDYPPPIEPDELKPGLISWAYEDRNGSGDDYSRQYAGGVTGGQQATPSDQAVGQPRQDEPDQQPDDQDQASADGGSGPGSGRSQQPQRPQQDPAGNGESGYTGTGGPAGSSADGGLQGRWTGAGPAPFGVSPPDTGVREIPPPIYPNDRVIIGTSGGCDDDDDDDDDGCGGGKNSSSEPNQFSDPNNTDPNDTDPNGWDDPNHWTDPNDWEPNDWEPNNPNDPNRPIEPVPEPLTLVGVALGLAAAGGYAGSRLRRKR